MDSVHPSPLRLMHPVHAHFCSHYHAHVMWMVLGIGHSEHEFGIQGSDMIVVCEMAGNLDHKKVAQRDWYSQKYNNVPCGKDWAGEPVAVWGI